MEIKLRRLSQILLCLVGLLALRMAQLQVLQGPRYSRLSDRNRIRRVTLLAPRGRILDRNGKVIADNRPSFTVSVVPSELPDTVVPRLARLLKLDPDAIASRLGPGAAHSRPAKLRRNLDQPTFLRIEENRFRLPGVRTSVDPVRSYPDGPVYCHILGFLGEVSEAELKADTTYEPLDYVGREGIEARYEALLRGVDGYEYAEVDVRGREIGPLAEKRPVQSVPGKDVCLTVDDKLQRLAYELTSGYDRAAVVGLEIASGGILCLVSQPGFDPNAFVSTVLAEDWNRLLENPSKPLFNRVTGAGYPPGSVLKPVVALAALNRGVATTETRFEPCRGQYRYGNRVFHCWTRHGSTNLLEAIAHSCNVYFYQLGLKLGLDSLASFCQRLLPARPTGIDLPSERTGHIPTRQWLDDRYGKGEWTSGIVLNLAIGQGEVLATPLQLALAYAAIASGGTYGRPHLFARADSDGRTIRSSIPLPVRVSLNPDHLKSVKLALTRVVEHGTARAARLEEITIAGKTGTAENPSGLDHALFVGYAPAEQPEVVFAVVVENAGHGGAVAAPIAQALFRAHFEGSAD